MGPSIVTVGAEDEFLAIRGEHWEGIEAAVVGYLGKVASVYVDGVHVEREASCIFMIRGEDDALAVRHKVRCPVGLAQLGNLAHVTAISVCNKYFHISRHYQALLQEVLVFGCFLFCRRPGGTPYDL